MNDFATVVSEVNSSVNDVVWGVPALTLLIGTGVLMTVLTGFFQFTRFGHMLKKTIGRLFAKKVTRSSDKNSISQFQALCTALSATIGTGNIAGVAYAITMGGPGAVFWMWIAAIVGMMTNYSENVLGIFFRRRNSEKEWSGGAMYYLRDGLGSRKHCKTIGKVLAFLFCIFTILASFGIGNMGQISTIRESVLTVAADLSGNAEYATSQVGSLIVGSILMIVAFLVIIGGLKRIAETNEKIVPFMAVFYILGSIVIVVMNADRLLPALGSIFRGAFNFQAAAGGVGGAVIAKAMTWGFKRGVFSNEAGLGSSVMVHSTSDVKEPVTQGLWGIFEVFVDTIIVCTLTALVILTSGVVDIDTGSSLSGVTKLGLATEAFSESFGSFGGIFIAAAVTLFAFSTCLGWSFYGKKAWEYLFGTKSTIIYKVIFLAAILASSILDTALAIDLSDTFNGLMAIPNLIGVVALCGLVRKITKNYVDRRIKGITEVKPMLSAIPEIQAEQEMKLAENDE
ncbi:MAG: sodium:alanine symporter family protein [Lachnospiraceae bacterium]|nr:sodium:alanine symporter family protein [Lachnospiraceae bacterium]